MSTTSLFRKIFHVTIVTVLISILSSCAPAISLDECLTSDSYGFLGGLWHGFIAPFSLVISIFKDSVAVYAVNNNGGWYDFGFVLGAAIFFGGGGKASKR